MITKGEIKFKDHDIDDNAQFASDDFNKFHKYVNKNKESIKDMYEIRKYIRDKLLAVRYTDEYYNRLAKHSRAHIIETLLQDITTNNKYDPLLLQIVLDEIDLSSRKSIKNWYSLSLGSFKYNYINELSENIIVNDDELMTDLAAESTILVYTLNVNPHLLPVTRHQFSKSDNHRLFV
jgi:hypothetical protein